MNIIAAIILMSLSFIPAAQADNIRDEKKRQSITPYGAACEGSYGMLREHMTIPDAVRAIKDYFEKKGLTVEIIDHWSRFIMADIYDGAIIVDRVIMDRKTGRLRSTY